jgi:hypothetical protein
MDFLPRELTILISLHLKPLSLSVNKFYNSIYDDIWYEEYLQILYPETKLWKRTTYKDLYIKSLESVNIKYKISPKSRFIFNFPMECITAYVIHDYKRLMLTFNGDLYLEDKLLDTHVIALHGYSYATNDKWIRIDKDFNIVEIMEINNIIKIGEVSGYLYAVTSNNIYKYNIYTTEISISKLNNIRDVCSSTVCLYLLTDNEKVYFHYPQCNIPIIYSNGIIKLHGNGFITNENKYVTYDMSLISDCEKILFGGYNTTIKLNNGHVIVDDMSLAAAKDVYVCDDYIYIMS